MKKKILIVEDESSLLSALVEKLTKEGFETLEAKNGEEGLVMAKKEKPDLILLDIVMPVMDGITMLKQMRNSDWGKEIPVIMLTNLSEDDKVDESLENGAFEYLVKSDWKLEDVVKKIRIRLSI